MRNTKKLLDALTYIYTITHSAPIDKYKHNACEQMYNDLVKAITETSSDVYIDEKE